MQKLLSFALGFGMGAAVGLALVLLFAPTSGDDLIARLKTGWQDTRDDARKASQERRAALEAELASKRRPAPRA